MTSASSPAVSVIVPFYNRREEVKRCLDALLAQQLSDGAIELVLVDNGSTDGTREALATFPATVVDCATPGPAAARNAGVRAATAPIVAFLDSDCVADAEWLDRLVAPFADASVRAAGGRIIAQRIDTGVAYYAETLGIINQSKLFAGAGEFPPYFATANAAFRREDILAVGGFDESLRTGEDADLVWRILDKFGGKLVYEPRALVHHAHRETFEGLYRQAWSYGAGSADLRARHGNKLPRRPFVDAPLLLNLAAVPVRLPWFLLTGGRAGRRLWGLYEAIWFSGFALGRWGRRITR